MAAASVNLVGNQPVPGPWDNDIPLGRSPIPGPWDNDIPLGPAAPSPLSAPPAVSTLAAPSASHIQARRFVEILKTENTQRGALEILSPMMVELSQADKPRQEEFLRALTDEATAIPAAGTANYLLTKAGKGLADFTESLVQVAVPSDEAKAKLRNFNDQVMAVVNRRWEAPDKRWRVTRWTGEAMEAATPMAAYFGLLKRVGAIPASAVFVPQTQQKHFADMVAEGIPVSIAKPISWASAPLVASIEAIEPNWFRKTPAGQLASRSVGQAVTRFGIEFGKRFGKEWIVEEGGQAATEYLATEIARGLSENHAPHGVVEGVKTVLDQLTQAGGPIFMMMGPAIFTGASRAVREGKMGQLADYVLSHENGPTLYAQMNPEGAAFLEETIEDHTPTRAEWKKAGLPELPGIGVLQRAEFARRVRELFVSQPATTEQAAEERDGLHPQFLQAAALTPQEGVRPQFYQAATQAEAALQAQAATPQVPVEVPVEGQPTPATAPEPAPVVPAEAIAPEAAQAPPEAVGPPAAAVEPPPAVPPGQSVTAEQGPPTIDPVVALNHAHIEAAWATLGLGELPAKRRQSFEEIKAQAAESKADETAMGVAGDILKTRRALTPLEHMGLVLRYAKEANDLDASYGAAGLAVERGDSIAAASEAVRQGEILARIERLTEAAWVGGTEASAALWIRKLRINREDFSLERVLQRKRAIKGSQLTAEEVEIEGRAVAELTARNKEMEAILAADAVKIAEFEAAEASRIVAVEVAKAKVERKKVAGRATAQAKLLTERAEIKAAIAALGYRLNKLTGVSAEGSYQIGRLAINYIRGGMSTLAEVTQQVLSDIPELSATDVNQALNAKNPNVQRRVRSAIEKRVAQLKSQALVLTRLDQATEDALPERKPRPEEPADTVLLRKERRAIERRLGLEEKLDEVRKRTEPKPVKRRLPGLTKTESPVISAIKDEIRAVEKKLRVAAKISQAAKGVVPEKKTRKVESPELQEMRKRLRELRQLNLLTLKIERATRGVFERRKKRTTPAAIAVLQKVLRDLRREAYRSDMDAGRFDRAMRRLTTLQTQLANGQRDVKAGKPIDPANLAEIKQAIQAVRHEMGVTDQLADLQEQLRTGKYKVAPKRIVKPISPELERKQIQIARLRKEIRNRIEEAAPWTKSKVGMEVLDTLRTLKATGDISFTFRQNAALVFSHPLIAATNFVPSLKAMYSQYSMDQINNSLRNSPNALYYDVSKLALLDVDSHLPSQREELFRGRFIESMKLPGLRQISAIIRASNRHATTFSNLMRASVFDQFMLSVPNATIQEMQIYANLLNVATGLGDVGSLGNAINWLSVGFFAPRLTVSRFQTPYKVYKIMRTQPRLRKAVARDMVGFVATGGTVLALAALAGASVSGDPDDPDFGKIRIGDMRFDIWGGFLQPARLIARLGLVVFRGLTRDSEALRKLRGQDWVEFSSQFVIYKAAPIVSLQSELWTRKTAVGEPVEVPGILARTVIPMWMEDVYDGWKRYGAAGAAGALPTITGIGVQTYEDSETKTREKIRQAAKGGDREEANRIMRTYNLRNPKNPIRSVKLKSQ